MLCVLCRTDVDLFDLDAEGYAGLPAHKACAEGARAAVAAALDAANAMVLAEPDPRMHRGRRAPAAALG